MNNDGIEYVLRWSEEIDDGFFEDFMRVENAVFGGFPNINSSTIFMAHVLLLLPILMANRLALMP